VDAHNHEQKYGPVDNSDHKTSRSFMTDREKFILKQVLDWSLQDSIFPTKFEIVKIASNVCCNNEKREHIADWEYLRRVIRTKPFKYTYKKIHARSSGQILTLHKTDEINQFWAKLHATYLDRSGRVQTCKIWVMDESSFRDGDFTSKGYGKKGGENQQVIGKNLTHTDTLVGTISSHGDTFAYYIRHQKGQYTLEGAEENKGKIFRDIKGMNGQIMLEWTKAFLLVASYGDILVLDNLSAHKVIGVLRELQEGGITVLFTPSRMAW
jgi:hypothetical protein